MSLQKVSGYVGHHFVNSSASGFLPIIIPAYIAEHSRGTYFEHGERLCLYGFWDNNTLNFHVSSLKMNYGYKQNVAGIVNNFRAFCRISFKRLLSSWGVAGGLIVSLLSGSRDCLSPDVCNSFRNAGLSHILALSGMHLSFISGLTGMLCYRIFGKKYELLARFSGIIIFVWFAGFSPSLFRAFLFSLLLMILVIFKCRVDEDCFISVLSSVFLLHIMIRPYDLFTIAFMLSYAALAGILILGNVFLRYACRVLPSYIAGSVSSSVSAFIATSPISLGFFGYVNPIGILASVIVSPLISLFLAVSFFCILFSIMLSFLSPVFSSILNELYYIILFFVNFFARG
ncbi:MAG: ComEC/Rec2 family competence protein [Treponema sp.]|nr:ComEC/Rec2 family competence protein [Treponema sp.]